MTRETSMTRAERQIKYDEKKIEQIQEAARFAFWAKVVEMVPEAESGDLDPMASYEIDRAMESAIELWIRWNVPVSDYTGE
jgi:hypothetical protein